MNVEVEIKIKITNFKKIKDEISKKGKLSKSIRQTDEYYVPCHRNFFNQKPYPMEWLRIRNNPDESIFEYDLSINKKADGKQDYAEEYETVISNVQDFRKILKFLDFKKIITVDKNRQYWDCGNLEVVLDEIKDLGFFIEVEAKGDFENTAEAEKECIEFAQRLGIRNARDKQIKKGYPVLLLEKLN